ncbi:hypothetical protein DSCA_26490 [Desulfosarcina alkanivorans]|uniref:DUF3089 domain-containing protein n=1 Tax=Desulfosarcina alkanivorans TaxID=571177 RepID=A0A5K7YLG1_9BACT|nr:DUF3089 domain-containing protein [Desulfosarcina alkanivorans]BBO68719.1 hypothetical protein DSCA_26490 [Desulfosarcina alkanivorans]
MKNRKLLIFFSLTAFIRIAFLNPCQAMPPLDLHTVPVAPDYALQESWLAKPTAPTAPVDVFFVYPTVLFNDTDWIMDTARPDMRAAAQITIDTQAAVFEGQANVYVPMYRQMNIAGLGLSDADAAPLHEIIHSDVWRALTHYLKHENRGRPFFLAGHSQGSMILTDLMLEHWGTTGAEAQLIAALLPGWSLTSADLAAHPAVRMCGRSDQTGCVISYNSVADGRQSAAPTLKSGALAVNPLSWSMDGAFVPAEKNLGSVFFDADGKAKTYPYFTSARIVAGGLVVRPENVDLLAVEGGHFPEGVYHAFDYSLFFLNLKANIAERIEAFRLKSSTF